jgi:squalene synthase HpnC
MTTAVKSPLIDTVARSASEQLVEAGWAKLPTEYRIPAVAPSLAEAREYCKRLAESHYENFHVASWFLPQDLRPHFHAVYAYCRISDDLGDEVGDREQSLALLELWQHELDACYRGEARHPAFVALADTVRVCKIPQQPFNCLLTAFRRDQSITRFANMDEVLNYCQFSATPVGHLVLYICGYSDAERQRLSDFTCSALQLANFWQDVGSDFTRGRVYIPQSDMTRFGVHEEVIRSGQATPQFLELMRHEVAYTREMFRDGMPLIAMVNRELAVDLDLFSRGGLEILRAIEQQNYDVLRARPAISRSRKLALLLRALAARWLPGASRGSKR